MDKLLKIGKFPVEEAGCEETEIIEAGERRGVLECWAFGDVSILGEEVA